MGEEDRPKTPTSESMCQKVLVIRTTGGSLDVLSIN